MIDGILPVGKPENISSAQVVARVKRALQAKKAGHTGTLDPFATGLVLVALGKATRISKFFLEGRKSYTAQVTLGIETDTYDRTGTRTSEADPSVLSEITPSRVEKTVLEFKGVQDQVAPSFSALKHEGTPLYKLARQGKMILKPPRRIEIFDIGITRMDLPQFEIRVVCSSGTYIRSLAHDMGRTLGCGAHLSGLIRTGSSQFRLENAVSLEEIDGMDNSRISQRVVSMSDCLAFMDFVRADSALARKIRYGQKLGDTDIDPDRIEKGQAGGKTPGYVRVIDESGDLLAVISSGEKDSTYNYSCVFAG
ncbi:tRNA pseudouridine(55) synthase TruB [Desulfospira joergensenii]|uniref:tRNA pseudouridine(55) synthase TruB n=1 Tax=Desulfospira joergensenii TaxID=53329 RepID=UPI0003B4D26A|nr:tRNA pseudouridine(55) synthase TruB [Desulfospira joergensenii]